MSFEVKLTMTTRGTGDDAGFHHEVAVGMGDVGSKEAVNAILMAVHEALQNMTVGKPAKK